MRSTDILRQEHERILTALSVLTALADRAEPPPRAHVDQLVAFFRGFADRCHHAKEETALFPALEGRGIPRRQGPIGVMLQEHEEGRALLRAVAEHADDPARFAASARAYEELLSGHIHKENEILFRMADRVLDAAADDRIAAQYARFDTDELGPGERERLLADVAALARTYLGAP